MDSATLRRAARVAGWLLALGPTAGQAVAEGSRAGDLPRWRARMYALPSRQVWDAALATLKRAHLGITEIDRGAQAAVTAMSDFDRAKMPLPELPARYQPRKVQFHMFVSPFAEPARVYVGSILQVDDSFAPDMTAYLYGVPGLEGWLFGELEAVLGQGGRTMPATPEAREALAQSLGASASSSGCAGVGGSVPAGAQVKEPQPIKITRVQPVYPGKGEYAGGIVKVEATLQEDGSIVGARALQNAGPSAQYARAAVEAVRLWRYRPTRVGDCPMQIVMTVRVEFRPR